jgi:predicted DNA-binding ribbon-helix-helix protein
MSAAGNEGDAARVRKRSVRIAGHRTSVSLEDAFWQELAEIARTRALSVNALIAAIDAQRGGNLSSAIRVYVLETVRAQANS